MNIQLHTIHWLSICGIVGAIVLFAAASRCRGIPVKVVLAVLALAALAPSVLVLIASFPHWVDERIRVYQAFYDEIRPGMTREDVNALIHKHYPDAGPRLRPLVIVDEAESLSFFMNPEAPGAEPDCEGILISLDNHRVVTKNYSPD